MIISSRSNFLTCFHMIFNIFMDTKCGRHFFFFFFFLLLFFCFQNCSVWCAFCVFFPLFVVFFLFFLLLFVLFIYVIVTTFERCVLRSFNQVNYLYVLIQKTKTKNIKKRNFGNFLVVLRKFVQFQSKAKISSKRKKIKKKRNPIRKEIDDKIRRINYGTVAQDDKPNYFRRIKFNVTHARIYPYRSLLKCRVDRWVRTVRMYRIAASMLFHTVLSFDDSFLSSVRRYSFFT